MFLGAANQGGEVSGIGATQGIVEADDTPSAFDEGFECALGAIAHVAVVPLIDDKYINALKLLQRWDDAKSHQRWPRAR